jgi:hypothetical protein
VLQPVNDDSDAGAGASRPAARPGIFGASPPHLQAAGPNRTLGRAAVPPAGDISDAHAGGPPGLTVIRPGRVSGEQFGLVGGEHGGAVHFLY